MYICSPLSTNSYFCGGGVHETPDASSKKKFTLRAALLWTINDFPALAYLYGWSTGGRYACPSYHRRSSPLGRVGQLPHLPPARTPNRPTSSSDLSYPTGGGSNATRARIRGRGLWPMPQAQHASTEATLEAQQTSAKR
jgi:hypothetical protein